MEIAITVHGHNWVMPFIGECVGDGGVHPRTIFIGVVLKIPIGIVVDRRHNVNRIRDWMNDNRCTTAVIVVIG